MDNDSGGDRIDELIRLRRVRKNDQDQVDGMSQEVYPKGKEMHNEMSGQ